MKIIEDHITNEDGDFYGVCGELTRKQAYKAIRSNLEEYGIEDDVEFTPEDLEEYEFYQTIDCPHNNEHEAYIWWGKPVKGDKVKLLGKGWGVKPFETI